MDLNHEVVVGAESDVDLARANLPNAEVFVEPNLVRAPSPRDALALTSLVRQLRSGRYVVAVSHQSKAAALLRAAALSTPRLPIVHSLSMASFGPGYGRLESAVFRGIEATLGRRTDAFVSVGADLAQRYTAQGLRAERFHVVRSAAAVPQPHRDRDAARARFGLRAGDRVLAYVGSLDARKGVTALPDLMALVGRRLGEVPSLLVAGSGPLEAELRRGAEALGIADRLVLAGYVKPIDDVIGAADAVVLLSRAEGLPQVLMQAAAMGVPFVSYDADGARELCELGARGAVVPLGDLPGVARELAAVLIQPEAARRTADLSSWDRDAVQQRYREVVEPLLARGRVGSLVR